MQDQLKKVQIKEYPTGKILFEGEYCSLGACIEDAIDKDHFFTAYDLFMSIFEVRNDEKWHWYRTRDGYTVLTTWVVKPDGENYTLVFYPMVNGFKTKLVDLLK